MGYGAIAMWTSPAVESAMGLASTEEQQEEARRMLSVRVRVEDGHANGGPEGRAT